MAEPTKPELEYVLALFQEMQDKMNDMARQLNGSITWLQTDLKNKKEAHDKDITKLTAEIVKLKQELVWLRDGKMNE